MRPRMTIMAALAVLACSVGLYPLFDTGQWFWRVLGSVLAVAAGGLLARRLRLPAFTDPLFGLAALLVYLTALYARDLAWLWVVPSPAAVGRLGDLAADGWDSANRYAAPVPLVPGIAMLTAAGVGLVAVLVDLLAVRLRRAAPAGLPLLAMYSVPAAVHDDGVGWPAFGVGALGFLALLMADAREQVGGWGRTVATRRWSGDVPMAGAAPPADRDGARPDAGALAASGRRIGVAAVAVAVLVPMAVPGIHPRGMFGMGGGGHGDQTVTTPDPLVSLKRELTRTDDSVVLTYRSDDPAGPDYLRLYALDRFDGDRWTYSALRSSSKDRLSGRTLPPPPGLHSIPSHEVTTRVQVRSAVKNMTFLPVPYAPTSVSIKGDWRVHRPSLMVYSLRDSAGGRAYTVRSLRVQPTQANLASAGDYPYPPEIASHYTAVPKDVPPEVRALAQKVTAGSATAHAQAVRLQRWFTDNGGYTYDLGAPAPQHGSDLVDFLLHDRRGYCEQFAAAMALMARILGIPSRVAMGYTPGTQTGPGEWVVRSRDAHAWPELYFEGSGWVRFEPTPAGAGGQGTATAPAYSQPTLPGGGRGQDDAATSPSTTSPSGSPTDPSGAGPRHRVDDQGPASAPLSEDEPKGGRRLAPWAAAGLLVALLLAAPMALRVLMRRRRWSAAVPASPARTRGRVPPGGDHAAHAAWREMRADALDHGLGWPPSDSPRAAARRLGELLELDEAGAAALARIARAEELARYSASRSAEPPERLRADVRTVRDAFAAAVGPGTRWRARLLPPSTMAQMGDTVRTAGHRAMTWTDRLKDLPTRPRRD